MTDCLNQIELEDAVVGQPSDRAAGHLADCARCRQRLAEQQAIRARVGRAFDGVRAPAGAADRILAAIDAGAGRHRRPQLRRLGSWGALAAAASLLIALTAAVVVHLSGPTPAEAAALELVRIHQDNLAGRGPMLRHESADASRAYLAERLDFASAMPDPLLEQRMKGCCVLKFMGQPAANLVLDGPHGQVSLVVSDVSARRLATGQSLRRGSRTYWICPMQGFNTVAVQRGSLVYSAVGAETPEYLVELLAGILDHPPTSQP